MGFTLCKFTWSGFGIHLITTVSVIKRYKFIRIYSLGPRSSVCVRIRESPYYRGSFLKKIYENFVGTLETVRNIGVCIREVWSEVRFDCSLVGEREIHLWCVYVLHKMSSDIWKLSEANIIIFSLNHYCVSLLKTFCSFLFLPFKGSQEFAFRRVQRT